MGQHTCSVARMYIFHCFLIFWACIFCFCNGPIRHCFAVLATARGDSEMLTKTNPQQPSPPSAVPFHPQVPIMPQYIASPPIIPSTSKKSRTGSQLSASSPHHYMHNPHQPTTPPS